MKTFVFDGTEIKLTGREAVKKVVVGFKTRELKLVEITPADNTFDWKKWVPMEQLYEISE